MRRREFIAGLGSAAAWPVVARAQQPPMPVIGFLSAQSGDDEYKMRVVPFLQGLKETGYVSTSVLEVRALARTPKGIGTSRAEAAFVPG